MNIRLTYNDSKGKVGISFDYNERVIELVKTIDGRRFIPGNKSWTVPITPESMRVFEHFRKHYRISFDDAFRNRVNAVKRMRKHIRERTEILHHMRLTGDIPESYQPCVKEHIPSFDHQRVMTASAICLGRIAFFVEMGAGKTKASIQALLHWMRLLGNGVYLCTGPTESIFVWEEQYQEYAPGMKVMIVPGGLTPKKRLDRIEEVYFESKTKPVFVVANFDSIRVAKSKFEELKPKVAIIDESHLLKSIKAKRTQAILDVIKPSEFRIILSGTAILNSVEDVFSQILLLDDGATFGTDATAFRNRYFYDENVELNAITGGKVDWPSWVLKDGSEKKIRNKINTISVQYTKDECMDLPEKLYAKLYIELPKKQMKFYKDLVKKNVAEIGDKVLLTKTAITRVMKLRQITSGFFFHNDEVTGQTSENYFDAQPKLDALKNFFHNLKPNQKMIVWTCFVPDCNRVYDMFLYMGEDPAKIVGGMSVDDRRAAVSKFQNDDKCRVFVATVQAAGRSISLTAASYAVYFSNSYDLEHRQQSEDRPHRTGLKNDLTIVDIVAKGTIDEAVLTALKRKKNLAKCIISIRDLAAGKL